MLQHALAQLAPAATRLPVMARPALTLVCLSGRSHITTEQNEQWLHNGTQAQTHLHWGDQLRRIDCRKDQRERLRSATHKDRHHQGKIASIAPTL